MLTLCSTATKKRRGSRGNLHPRRRQVSQKAVCVLDLTLLTLSFRVSSQSNNSSSSQHNIFISMKRRRSNKKKDKSIYYRIERFIRKWATWDSDRICKRTIYNMIANRPFDVHNHLPHSPCLGNDCRSYRSGWRNQRKGGEAKSCPIDWTDGKSDDCDMMELRIWPGRKSKMMGKSNKFIISSTKSYIIFVPCYNLWQSS